MSCPTCGTPLLTGFRCCLKCAAGGTLKNSSAAKIKRSAVWVAGFIEGEIL